MLFHFLVFVLEFLGVAEGESALRLELPKMVPLLRVVLLVALGVLEFTLFERVLAFALSYSPSSKIEILLGDAVFEFATEDPRLLPLFPVAISAPLPEPFLGVEPVVLAP